MRTQPKVPLLKYYKEAIVSFFHEQLTNYIHSDITGSDEIIIARIGNNLALQDAIESNTNSSRFLFYSLNSWGNLEESKNTDGTIGEKANYSNLVLSLFFVGVSDNPTIAEDFSYSVFEDLRTCFYNYGGSFHIQKEAWQSDLVFSISSTLHVQGMESSSSQQVCRDYFTCYFPQVNSRITLHFK